jgi:DNA-binding SARP family transcriptional activator
MRFVIMQVNPGYRHDEMAVEQTVFGQEGMVLRVLILHQGRALAKDEIARHLTRRSNRAVSPGSVPSYIARLRAKIGTDRVRSTAAGYSSDIDPVDVDAFRFEKTVEEYDLCNFADIDDIGSTQIDLYDNLLDLYAQWKTNPALSFADEQDDEYLASRYLDFERYRDCLKRCIIYAELRSRRKPRIEKAIGRIEQLLAQDPQDEQSWVLLFRARASLPGGAGAVPHLLARIQEKFPGGIPAELAYTVKRITNGHRDALFELDRGQRSQEDQQRVNQLVQTIGISPASELELRRSKLEPFECISQTVSMLRFCGILATKWVADSYILARFTELLERLDHSGGSVQFLLLDPESASYQRFSRLRWSPASVQPIDMLRQLVTAHPSFAVRLYDALPTFRIVLIDQSIVSFSPYLMDSVTQRARTGWEAPHIVLDRTAPWPLAHTFETLFDETWRTASPLLQ